MAVAALLLAVWVLIGLWRDPTGRTITVNSGDHVLFEWLLAYGPSGRNPLFAGILNVPDGVNLAVNTSVTVFAWAFAPLTWLAGPSVSFLVILTLNLAGTAFAWYWLLSRHLGASTGAAALGGLFCGFAPGLVSHANAHLNWTAQWLMVLIVWATLRLRSGSPLRRGLVLGLLVAAGFSIAAEALFFTALALGVFVAAWAVARRVEARAAAARFGRGLAVAGAVALVLLAYPLWMHFLGPQRYHGIGFDQRVHSEDLLAYGAYPARSLAGLAGLDTSLAPNPTEETTFYGLPLLAMAVACFVLLWRRASPQRRAVLGALGVTALLFGWLSLGPRYGLYALLAQLPIFNAALPARFALAVTPVIGILLAWAWDALPWRRRYVAALAVALLPLVPLPLLTSVREPVPTFVTSGQWRPYVPPGRTLVALPLPSDLLPDGQRWQAVVLSSGPGAEVFPLPSGFFLGPGGPDGRGRIGPVPRPTEQLLFDAARTGVVPPVSDADRARAADDLRHWRASAIVLADRVHGSKWPVHVDALRSTATALFGPPTRVDDVWLWQVP